MNVAKISQIIKNTECQLNDGNFDLLAFIKVLDDLDNFDRKMLLNRIAWNHSIPRVLVNQPLSSLIKFFEFLDSKDYFKESEGIRNARGFLGDKLDNKIQLLLHIIKNIESISETAIIELASTDTGLDELEKIVSDSDEKYREIVAVGLGNIIAPDFLDSLNYPSVNRGAHHRISIILNKLVEQTGSKSSYIASKALYYGCSLSVENMAKLLKSSSHLQRNLGLTYYQHARIDVENVKSHIPFIVELLEDNKIDVSKNALKALGYFSPEFSEIIADTILDLLVVRSTNRPQEFFNSGIVISGLKEVIKYNPRLQGIVLHNIKEIAIRNKGSTQYRAIFVGIGINKKEFLALIGELQADNPVAAKSIADIVSGTLEISQIASQISETDPKDIQQNAANQIGLLTKYYENGLLQAKSSFNWAIGITVLSVLAFIVITLLFGKNADKTIVWITAISSGLAELIAGTLLIIYQKTLSQLNNYNHQMSKIQDFLLANSFIESLSQDAQDSARLELIRSLASSRADILQPDNYKKESRL